MNKEDLYIISHAEDKCRESFNRNILTSTNFLDMHQQSVLSSQKFPCRFMFYGGFDDAERRVLCFLPDYMDIPYDILSILKVTHNSPKALSHRDYLGALMSLGIKRENIGDILTSEGGAQIIIKKEIGEFLVTNLVSAGRAHLSTDIVPIEELVISESSVQEISKTVASMRIDSVLAAIFNISRTQSCEYINRGMVFINSCEITKPDKQVTEGDKITLRTKGKAVITSAGKLSKKGRIIFSAAIYK